MSWLDAIQLRDLDAETRLELTCRTCGKVAELEDHELAHALEDAARRLGFKLGKATIEAEGQCAVCTGAAAS